MYNSIENRTFPHPQTTKIQTMGCCFSETDHSRENRSHPFLTDSPHPPPKPICARKAFIPKQPPYKRPSQQNHRQRWRTKSCYLPKYDEYDDYDDDCGDLSYTNMTDYEAAVLSASKEAEEEDRILENMFKVKFNNYDT